MVLLTDCMSPVTGFEGETQTFFAEAAAKGVLLLKSQGDKAPADILKSAAPAGSI